MGIGRKASELGGSPAGASTIIKQVKGLFSGFNSTKKGDDNFEDGITGEKEPLLSLQIPDEDLIKLSNQWKKESDVYQQKITSRQEENYAYWKGDQYASKVTDSRGTDNVIFESVETFLPIVSRQNPEPTVEGEETEEGQFVADMTARILADKADENALKSKIKMAARHWALYFLGCFKMGWNEDTDDMYFQVINPQGLILDPHGTFDGAEFKGKYIGEPKTQTADDLATAFPKFADEITQSVDGKMGTSITYHEWWTNKYVFWRYKGIILDKRANPYWNEGQETMGMDAMGVETPQTNPGVNHFASPKMPYSFLTVFNTGKQPHDETSLIEQVKSLQDIVNKRLRQIDKNADDTNNGWVFSSQFSEDQAKTALNAMRNGGAIIATTESIQDSVTRFPAPELAGFVYQDMLDKREEIYNIMGVRGSTAQGTISDQTVRGKIQVKQQDVDRMSLVVEQIEEFVDHLFNLAVQTVYVYYDPEKASPAIGKENALRYIQLLKAGPSRRLVVSVKEGSTIPQDPLMRRNEAVDLWNSQALDPETLFDRLQFPDPKATAIKLETYKQNPPQYLADLGGQPMPQPVAPGGPEAPMQPPQVPTDPGLIPMKI
jgi:hypothetical protein